MTGGPDVTGLGDRLETILDALATSNRLARVNLEEIRRLQTAVVFVGVLLVTLYVVKGKHRP